MKKELTKDFPNISIKKLGELEFFNGLNNVTYFEFIDDTGIRKVIGLNFEHKGDGIGIIKVFLNPHRLVLRDYDKYDYIINLNGIKANYGGFKWYFICPVSGKKCSILYFNKYKQYFGSREGLNLSYPSQNLSKRRRQIYTLSELEDFNLTVNQRIRNGKLTKRFRQYLKKEIKYYRMLSKILNNKKSNLEIQKINNLLISF